ncbi:MAG: hypothetical protein SNJ75_03165, partial [Gemmataceae bacterium]
HALPRLANRPDPRVDSLADVEPRPEDPLAESGYGIEEAEEEAEEALMEPEDSHVEAHLHSNDDDPKHERRLAQDDGPTEGSAALKKPGA